MVSSGTRSRSAGERVQEIEIYLKFIGKFDVPLPEPTPEELAAAVEAFKKRRAERSGAAADGGITAEPPAQTAGAAEGEQPDAVQQVKDRRDRRDGDRRNNRNGRGGNRQGGYQNRNGQGNRQGGYQNRGNGGYRNQNNGQGAPAARPPKTEGGAQ